MVQCALEHLHYHKNLVIELLVCTGSVNVSSALVMALRPSVNILTVMALLIKKEIKRVHSQPKSYTFMINGMLNITLHLISICIMDIKTHSQVMTCFYY